MVSLQGQLGFFLLAMDGDTNEICMLKKAWWCLGACLITSSPKASLSSSRAWSPWRHLSEDVLMAFLNATVGVFLHSSGTEGLFGLGRFVLLAMFVTMRTLLWLTVCGIGLSHLGWYAVEEVPAFFTRHMSGGAL